MGIQIKIVLAIHVKWNVLRNWMVEYLSLRPACEGGAGEKTGILKAHINWNSKLLLVKILDKNECGVTPQ